MAEQRQQPGMVQHLMQCWDKISKSIPVSNGLAALLMTGLQEIFSNITDCPCNYSVEFGWATLLGPIAIVFAILAIIACDACRDCKCKRLARYSLLTFVASFAWGTVALLNSEAVCCIQGGFPSNSPCLVGRNATTNAVQYEECTANSRIAGVRLLMYGGAIFVVVLGILCIKKGIKCLVKN